MANISICDIPMVCHPQCDSGGVDGIKVSITRSGDGKILISYRVSGTLEALEIAGPASPNRIDDLWKTTCFELFIQDSEERSYIEYNFSTSGQWAAYAFSCYRENMRELDSDHPEIIVEQGGAVLTVSVALQLPDQFQESNLRAGVSAILATKRGTVSYWALTHPHGKPDFHHKDCFALQLKAPSAA